MCSHGMDRQTFTEDLFQSSFSHEQRGRRERERGHHVCILGMCIKFKYGPERKRFEKVSRSASDSIHHSSIKIVWQTRNTATASVNVNSSRVKDLLQPFATDRLLPLFPRVGHSAAAEGSGWGRTGRTGKLFPSAAPIPHPSSREGKEEFNAAAAVANYLSIENLNNPATTAQHTLLYMCLCVCVCVHVGGLTPIPTSGLVRCNMAIRRGTGVCVCVGKVEENPSSIAKDSSQERGQYVRTCEHTLPGWWC